MSMTKSSASMPDSRRGPVRAILTLLLAALAVAPAHDARAAVVTPPPLSCIDDDTARTNGCTAKDVDVAQIEVLQVFDGCTSTADTGRITAVMDYVAGASIRYDIGGFFAADGGQARTGTCYHNYLPPPLVAAPNHKPKSGLGPFLNAETSVTDTCGDIRSKDGLTRENVDLFYGEQGAMEIKCSDEDNNGYVDIGYCTFWDNNAGGNCTSIDTAVPGTTSKCRCARRNINLPIIPATGVTNFGQLPSASQANCSATGNNATLDLRIATGCTTLTINSISNNILGNLSGKGTCTLPQTLGSGGEYKCSVPVANTALTTYTTTVNATCNGTTPVTLTDSTAIDCFFEVPGCDSDAQCDDGLFCNGTESCVTGACQTSSGNPCPGTACNTCQEATDTCFDANGTACTDDGNACTTDTCNGSGACSHPAGNAGAVCRASGGVCDVAETCTGSSTSCPADAFAASTLTCRTSGGVCDVAEKCTGSSASCPADGFAASTTECRSASGVCDVAETCTGSSASCPADGFAATTVTCRGSSGVCDAAEKCTGSSANCPADVLEPSTTTCRGSAGVCDVAEKCTGSSSSCPADGFEPTTTTCRGSAGVCDLAEKCTGSSSSCPADGFEPTTTTCRGSGGVCDVAENCTGSSASCPADAFEAATTECRGSAGVCDVPENCTGSGASCPADGKSTAECRASAGVCDQAESCDGAGNNCPADNFLPASTECRGAAGVCDTAETCTGSSASCPADGKSTAECRASAGVCDQAETCDGVGNNCPADGFLPASTECRASAGECDVAEKCTGSGAACPANGVASAGTSCTSDGDVCTDDECNGSSTSCTHPDNTASCDDGLFCTVSDTCDAGTCSGTARSCHDGDACTFDTCNEAGDTCDNVADPACNDPIADLSLVKTDASSPVEVGAFATYTLTVTNAGPDTATDVLVIDTLDADTTWTAATRPCTEGPVGTLTCDLGDIASGASVSFDVVVHVDAGASTAGTLAGTACSGAEDLCNHASVQSTTDDPNPADNDAQVTTDVVPATSDSELTMTKTDLEPEPIVVGGNVTYRIELSNAGPDAASDVVVHEDLDPSMAYVSDTAGCSVSDPGTAGGGPRLTCSVGSIAAGSSTSFDVVVTILPSASTDGGNEDGDCGAGSDVCNDAVVTTSSPDFTVVNNRDREPTNVARAATCGNGMLDAGEQCDPPSAEICNNGIDDNGDTIIDCADAGCAVPGYQSCDASCRRAAPCNRIRKDPARITRRKVQIHGNFVPGSDVDPVRDGFLFVISNANGEIYRGRLLPGDMKRSRVPKGVAYWVYKDTGARAGRSARDGLYRVGIHQRHEKSGETLYVFRIAAMGDMSRATLAEMTTQVYIGGEVGYATAIWDGRPGDWSLSLARFEDQNP